LYFHDEPLSISTSGGPVSSSMVFVFAAAYAVGLVLILGNQVESYFFPPFDLGYATFMNGDLNRTKTYLLNGPKDFLNDFIRPLFLL
jgi:hypothetical protein